MLEPRIITLPDIQGPLADSDTTAQEEFAEATNLAKANHSHEIGQITGLGNAAPRSVGTGPGDVAAGDHAHSGVYEPVQTHVSPEEKSAGTSTAIRSWSPDDIKDMILLHESGAAVVAPTITSVGLSHEQIFVGQTISMVITDTDGVPPSVRDLAWLRDDTPISGETGLTFEVTDAEAGLPLAGRVTRTPAVGDPVVGESDPIVPIGAPEDLAGPFPWTVSGAEGTVAYDASALFHTPGDDANATLTYELLDSEAEPFVSGTYESDVFTGGPLLSTISINPVTGLISLGTGDVGEVSAAPLPVRASNPAGSAVAEITLTVSEVEEPTIASAHISATSGGSSISTAVVGSTLYLVEGAVTGVPAPARTYVWYDDGVEISGETAVSLVTTGLDGPITGKIVVTNTEGTDDATSGGVTLTPAETAVQWNTSDKYSTNVISGSGQITETVNANGFFSRANKFLTTQDAYFELETGAAFLHGTNACGGIATTTPVVTGALTIAQASAGGGVTYAAQANQDIFVDGSSVGDAPTSWQVAGSVLCVAVKMSIGKVFFRVNGGSWTGDPVAGTGGYDIEGSSVAAIACSRRNTGETNPGTIRLRSITSDFLQTMPPGFVSYGAA